MGNPDDADTEIADALLEIADELELFRDAFPRPRPDVTPLVEGEPGWPNAPGTWRRASSDHAGIGATEMFMLPPHR